VVFQGTPEELNDFDHPFNDEVIHSLESLQKELTGLYSQRQFKMMHHIQLKRHRSDENYCLVVFTLSGLESLAAKLGHEAAQAMIHSLGVYIDKHFGSVGGFSTRLQANEIITVLPFSNKTEAESILQEFIQDFQEGGLKKFLSKDQKPLAVTQHVNLAVLAGIAEGQPISEIDAIIEAARSQQKEIGRLQDAVEESSNEKNQN